MIHRTLTGVNVNDLGRRCQSCGADDWRLPNKDAGEWLTGMVCRRCGQVSDEPLKKPVGAFEEMANTIEFHKCRECADSGDVPYWTLCESCQLNRQAIQDLKADIRTLDRRRGGECEKCGRWVCPPLTCHSCEPKRILPAMADIAVLVSTALACLVMLGLAVGRVIGWLAP